MTSTSLIIPAHWEPPRIDVLLDNLPPLPPLPADRVDLPFYHKSYIQTIDRRGGEPGYSELFCQKPSEQLGDNVLATFVSSVIAQLRFPIQPGLSTELMGAIRSNTTLSYLALGYGFDKRLLLSNNARKSNTHLNQKALADTYEAYIGVLWKRVLETGFAQGVDATGQQTPFSAFLGYFDLLVSGQVFPTLLSRIDQQSQALQERGQSRSHLKGKTPLREIAVQDGRVF